MSLTMNFYEVAVNVIPVLLIALAVERFVVRDDDPTSRWQAQTAIAVLVFGESVALLVLAVDERWLLSDFAVIFALTFGLLLLALAYVEKVRPSDEERAARTMSKKVRAWVLAVVSVAGPAGLLIGWVLSHSSWL